ncbi:GNAT family protein [Staphylococcus chromogenes]|nr:GNAT family protein [Staphylococcus chromogenes]
MFHSIFDPDFPVRPPAAPRHPRHPGWPEATARVQLIDGAWLRLRPLSRRDATSWRELRIANQERLQPVEPTVDTHWAGAHTALAWRRMYQYLREIAASGQIVPMVIELDGAMVGQLTLGGIQHGAMQDCWIGYWVDQEVSGRGVAKVAVALGVDHAFGRIGLHRVTATYLPTNPASGAVLAANGFTQEGLLRRNLHIDGDWQDHYLMALLSDDYSVTAVERIRKSGVIR